MDYVPLVLSFVSVCLSAIVGVMVKASNKKSDQHDTLWDERNRKSNDSEKLERHEALISAMNSKHDLLDQKVGFQYAHILTVLEELKGLTIHKENGKEQGFNNMATLLNAVKSEIVTELHKTIDKKD